MMLMVQEVNRRLDTIPQPGTPEVAVTCATGHRGVSRPVPLATMIAETEEQFPGSTSLHVSRGNIYLMRGDTTAAAESFREALRRDSTNGEARGRLRAIGCEP